MIIFNILFVLLTLRSSRFDKQESFVYFHNPDKGIEIEIYDDNEEYCAGYFEYDEDKSKFKILFLYFNINIIFNT